MSSPRIFQQAVPARIGLLGNPSDLYGGSVIGFALKGFAATVKLTENDSGKATFEGPASHLLSASRTLIQRRLPEGSVPRGFTLSATTTIPRQVGLSGSSALVIGALRVMELAFGLQSSPFELAEEALAVETEELGMLAGPQDRVIQVFGGLLSMDFQEPRSPEGYRHLDPGLLPPLLMAWDPNPGTSSGIAHGEVYSRWQNRDPAVVAGMGAIADLAREGVRALEGKDYALFGQLVDRNFDHRRDLFDLDSRAAAPVELARREGACAKFCGSGTAVVVVARDEAHVSSLETAYRAFGWNSMRPQVANAICG